VFVNNVSFGVYAAIVQSDEYRDAKLGTAARMLPELLGPELVVPDVPAEPPPEQPTETLGVQVKPAPQSVSTLHWSCHLYAQVDTVVVVHAGAGVDGPGSHFELGGQAGVVAPGQLGYVSVWQIMFGPQSSTVVQDPGAQYPVVTVPASAAGGGATSGQSPPVAQSGAAPRVGSALGTMTQVNPFLQSTVVSHSWARATGEAASATARQPTEKRSFVNDMGSPFVGEGRAAKRRGPAVPTPCQRPNAARTRAHARRESDS